MNWWNNLEQGKLNWASCPREEVERTYGYRRREAPVAPKLGKEIDNDPSAPAEERQQRKRRLLKGPNEFREMRDEIRSKSKS
jgi:hypothetical protein